MSSIETSVAEALLPPTVAPPQIPDENATIAMDLKRPADDDANSDEVAALTTTPPPTIDNKSESIMLEVVVAVESSEAGAQVSDAVAEPCVERDFTQIDSATAPKPDTADVVVTPTEEEDDHLSPLMMDNHTVTEHKEMLKQPITRLQDIADRVHEIPEFRPASASRPAPTVPQAATPRLRDCDPGQSMGSMDSDVSASSLESREQRSSDEGGSSSAKDSGCDVASSAASSMAGDGGGRRDSNGSATADCMEPEMAEDTTPIEQPSDELAAQIVVQVQFYFSNENILKDAFLLKHVRRNKEGFVSLKLISSFKRVRQLTKDWRVVGVAIKRQAVVMAASSATPVVSIELNDVGTKVRRCEPLPVFDETMPSRTVVATDLPVGGRLTIESVSELFGKCGEIALIRILRPGGTIPADVRQFYNKHPELHERECALVEFTESQAARVAQELPGMQTFEMVAPKKKTGKKAPGGGGGVGGMGGASVSRIVESYRYPNYADVERSRGGELGGGDFKYGLRRGSAGYFVKYHDQHVAGASLACHHRRQSYGNALNGGQALNASGIGAEASVVEHCSSVQRRLSNCSIGSGGDLMMRKISNCSDGYCSTAAAGSDMSRRTSACSQDSTRRASQCSMGGGDAFGRRTSQCSSDYCPCARRASAQQCTDMVYRRNAAQQQPQAACMMEPHGAHQRYAGSRRVSFDGEFGERKLSNGPFYGFERKLSSSGFEAMRKLSTGDKFYDARKMSADSGYDRRSSLGSLGSEHRCMTTSGATMSTASAVPVLTSGNGAAAKADAFVRTPIGPDGSKGFTSRARKVGQVVGPV